MIIYIFQKNIHIANEKQANIEQNLDKEKILSTPLIPIPKKNKLNNSDAINIYTAQKMKFSIKYFHSKCDQIRFKGNTNLEER